MYLHIIHGPASACLAIEFKFLTERQHWSDGSEDNSPNRRSCKGWTVKHTVQGRLSLGYYYVVLHKARQHSPLDQPEPHQRSLKSKWDFWRMRLALSYLYISGAGRKESHYTIIYLLQQFQQHILVSLLSKY